MKIDLVITGLFSSSQLFSKTDRFSDKPGIYALFYNGISNIISSFQFREKELLYIGKTESSQISRDVNTHFNSDKTGIDLQIMFLKKIYRSAGILPAKNSEYLSEDL